MDTVQVNCSVMYRILHIHVKNGLCSHYLVCFLKYKFLGYSFLFGENRDSDHRFEMRGRGQESMFRGILIVAFGAMYSNPYGK